MTDLVREPILRVDYVSLVDMEMLLSVEEMAGEMLLAVAVRAGATRLIDNTTLRV